MNTYSLISISTLRKTIVAIVSVLLFSCGGGGGSAVTNPPTPSPGDSIPNNFSFVDQDDVELSTIVQSEAITISGIDVASTISISGGEYSIDGGPFVSTNGSIMNGQTVIAQQTSSLMSNTQTDAILTVGGISDTFSVSTKLVLNSAFVEKAEAISFKAIKLFAGNVYALVDDNEDLRLDNLNSGDLITIGVDFSLTEGVSEYALAIQLVPQSIVSQLAPGSLLGDVIKEDHAAADGEEIIDLGGVYIDSLVSTDVFAVLKTKLPALSQTVSYRVVVTPDITFLASGQGSAQTEELQLMPVLIDERDLAIQKLEDVLINVIELPNLSDNNDFTNLDLSETFDEEGFSNKPVFQTSVAVDISSLNDSESIELSMTWTSSKGDVFALGLMSSNDANDSLVNEKVVLEVSRDGGTAIDVPVVAYLTQEAHNAMSLFATPIQDIADEVPESGQFVLNLDVVENGVVIGNPSSFNFDLPLVAQDLSALELGIDDIINYAPLRAGSSNSACLVINPDIDSGLILPDSISGIFASTCLETPTDRSLWLFDFSSGQIISKVTDSNGDNYCITVSGSGILPDTYRLQKCRFDATTPTIGIVPQRFEFDGNKIVLQQFPTYLDVNFNEGPTKTVLLNYESETAPNFFRDSSGFTLDSRGRLFTVGDSDSYGLGDADSFKVSLAYSGETKVDYKPVIGVTSTGEVNLSLDILGTNISLIDGRFTHKKYLPKQISALSGNLAPVDVGNGAMAEYTLLGLSDSQGEIETQTITESYSPLDDIATILSSEGPITELASFELGNRDFDEELFSATYVILAFPITISGQVSGDINFAGDLTSQGVGISSSIESILALSISITGELDAFIASGGIEASLELINKKLEFASGGQFTVSFAPIPDKLQFAANSDLDLELKILKGTVEAFIKYPRVCWCPSVGQIVEKKETLYSSGYLFNDSFKVFTGNVNATIIDI